MQCFILHINRRVYRVYVAFKNNILARLQSLLFYLLLFKNPMPLFIDVEKSRLRGTLLWTWIRLSTQPCFKELDPLSYIMHVHVHGRSQLISSTQALWIRRLYLIRHNEAGLPSIWPLVSMETRKINIHTIDNNNNSYQVMTPELHKLAILSSSISPACKYLRRAFRSNRFHCAFLVLTLAYIQSDYLREEAATSGATSHYTSLDHWFKALLNYWLEKDGSYALLNDEFAFSSVCHQSRSSHWIHTRCVPSSPSSADLESLLILIQIVYTLQVTTIHQQLQLHSPTKHSRNQHHREKRKDLCRQDLEYTHQPIFL